LLAAPAALGFGIGGPDRRTVVLQVIRTRQVQASRHGPASDGGGGMDQHQDQSEGCKHQGQDGAVATAGLTGGPPFDSHLIAELGVGHQLGLLFGPLDLTLNSGQRVKHALGVDPWRLLGLQARRQRRRAWAPLRMTQRTARPMQRGQWVRLIGGCQNDAYNPPWHLWRRLQDCVLP
jgi:hypothetical protein